METYKILSAGTCSIEFNGREVGYMQSLDITCNYNMQKVRNLYDFEYQGFVRGFADYTITARKAFIEAESMFGTIESLTNLMNSISQLQNSNVDLEDIIQMLGQLAVSVINLVGQLPQGVTSIGNVKEVQEIINRVKSGSISIGELFSRIEFELKIKTATALQNVQPDFLGGLINSITGGKKDIWTLKGCKLNTRSIILDINNIIIMENINIVAKSFAEPMFSSYNQPGFGSIQVPGLGNVQIK